MKIIRSVYRVCQMFGVDPVRTTRAARGLPAYFRDLRTLSRQLHASNDRFAIGKLYPCLGDRYNECGSASGPYFHQDLLVAKRVFANRPIRHLDVGSRVDGFVAHVASFREIEVIDIRPLTSTTPNIHFVQLDLMAPIPPHFVNYCDSLSCLHTVEHFGLGRYGDPVCAEGHILGLRNLSRLLQAGGKFYFSVPIGPRRIEFNAHRVFDVAYLLELLQKDFSIDSFSYIDDKGDLHDRVALEEQAVAQNFGCRLGCGVFELTKKRDV